ncbi:PREDICTED: uncharacterized protein LOC108782373 [Cyphomyrmex costatus]|uniref:uncharacterized protein LOC108782373 n=1 Tax=Cyphomyrmex costatus TaxID=456900 RepID=UPI00085239E8|nr:PREDICTED: uncharacterized protein LOC108782373 [Cyphomyrmex costatus]
MASRNPEDTGTICNLAINEDLNASLARFWQIEHTGRQNTRSPEERTCEKHFESTYQRNEEGRFIVRLPVKEEQLQKIGDSQESALKRFNNLEKRFTKQPRVKEAYVKFMQEYLELKHMQEVHPEDANVQQRYYLAHHCVLKESSTTSLRVVFDASSKSSSGVSLNDALMVGPVVQQDLFAILLRFRSFKYVITADISKMYRQILVHQDQTLLQCANSIEEARIIRDQVAALLLKGGFVLRKWASNDEKLLQDVPSKRMDNSIMELEADGTTKTLGVKWNHLKDAFQYSIKISRMMRCTKRMMLASITRIFDPLGLLAPAIIIAKILIQELWKLQLEWDEALPLVNKVKEALVVKVSKTYYWSDSSIVLQWIKCTNKKLPVFVAHRIGEIQESTAAVDWNHVGSKENPADLVSRGISPKELRNSQLWWEGPAWL